MREGGAGRHGCHALAPLLLLFLALSACAPAARPPLVKAETTPRADVAQPEPTPRVKVGKAYQVNGVWYYPQTQPAYDERGVASWYGAKFHGRRTANGEIFDMNKLTAAHPTLPLPSFVRVTNLENGRSLVLRVNDRGPFVRGRIIDVSRRGAQLLGFMGKGTARVRVTLVNPDGETAVAVVPKPMTSPEERDALPALPREAVVSAPLPPPSGSPPSEGRAAAPVITDRGPALASLAAPTAGYVPARSASIFVQAGAFSDYDRARRLGNRLRPIGNARVFAATVDGQALYRVRFGPLDEASEAALVLRKVIESGIDDAHIVVE